MHTLGMKMLESGEMPASGEVRDDYECDIYHACLLPHGAWNDHNWETEALVPASLSAALKR